MSSQARLPGCCPTALRCGRDAVVPEDRFDRVACNVMAETLQPAADACVAPGRVLGRHTDHERGDVRLGARATGASHLRAVVLLGDEPPIPMEDGVGGHDSGDVCEAAPAEDLAFHGQAAPLVIGEAKPSGTVRGAEDTVLLEQVVNDRLLIPVDPAGEEKQEEGERRRQRAHGRSVPHGPSQFKGWSLQYRRPTDQTSVPEAQASTKASTRPFFRRCVLVRVFAPDGGTGHRSVVCLMLLPDGVPYMALRKTAIAISDELLQEIDRAARQRHESRNRFVTRVLRFAVRARRDAEITRRLNELFSDPVSIESQRREAAELDAAGTPWTDERW